MITGNIGFLLLGMWLIAMGVIPLTGLSFAYAPVVLNLLSIAAGVVILMGTTSSGKRWHT